MNKVLNKFSQDKIVPSIVIHCIGGNIKNKNTYINEKNFYDNWKINFGYLVNINNFFIQKMIKKKWGRILHISTAGIKSSETPIAYSCAKASLNNYVKNYGETLAKKNIVMSCLSPGPINLKGRFLENQMKNNTNFWKNFKKKHLPTNKLVNPSEILPLVKILISDNALSYSAVNWEVDGGYK